MDRTQTIIRRSTITTQALATMGVEPEWDRLLAAYLQYDALQFANAEWGAYGQANEQHDREVMRLEGRFGKSYKTDPEAAQLARIAYEKVEAAHNTWTAEYLDRYWKSSRDLALHPAPTLAAALFKVALMYVEDLGNDNEMGADMMEVVAADMARLNGEKA